MNEDWCVLQVTNILAKSFGTILISSAYYKQQTNKHTVLANTSTYLRPHVRRLPFLGSGWYDCRVYQMHSMNQFSGTNSFMHALNWPSNLGLLHMHTSKEAWKAKMSILKYVQTMRRNVLSSTALTLTALHDYL